jgi:hypothetical protein
MKNVSKQSCTTSLPLNSFIDPSHRISTSHIDFPNAVSLLGIIELAMYSMYKLNVSFEKKAYYAFADVHFALFFTPLFNAFQSCTIAFFISRSSRQSWVIAENQDTSHYEEIHKEYNVVKNNISRSVDSIKQYLIGDLVIDGNVNSQTSPNTSPGMEHDHDVSSVASVWDLWIHFARLPRMRRKCNSLLGQLRFHELRKYFIQANELPLTFPLSDYLKRCEMHVLHELVHISTFKWVILAGAVDLLYFHFGVHTYFSDGKGVNLGYVMAFLFFSSMLTFVVVSLIIRTKINNIFCTTINSQELEVENEGSDDIHRFRLEGAAKLKQLSLFWGGNTRYIINMIQFMQFGFAIAFSSLLIYWFDMDSKENKRNIPRVYYLICVVLCFLCFVAIMSHVIPCFTICSNFGHLVDKKRLDQTLARHLLETLVQKQQDHTQKVEDEEAVSNQLGPIPLSPQRNNKPKLLKPTLSSMLYSYFCSREYLNFSALGTMICFSLVAMRLEAFMIEMGPYYDVSDAWHVKSNICFWLEVFFLSCFLFGDILALAIFRNKAATIPKAQCYFWAAIFDILICSSCLLLLLTSQQKRCCSGNENWFLSSGIKVDSIECCPSFGNRLFGGFGMLEMFTSLIVLRFFRFWAASVILRLFGASLEKNKEEACNNKLMKKDAFDSSHKDDHHDSSHGTENLQEEKGTITDFWLTALSKHPDIVEKHGEFSGLLLKVMLGIPIMNDSTDEENSIPSDHLQRKESKASTVPEICGHNAGENRFSMAHKTVYNSQKHSFRCTGKAPIGLNDALPSKIYILKDIKTSRDWESTEYLTSHQDMKPEIGNILSRHHYSMRGRINDEEMTSRLNLNLVHEEIIDDEIKVSDFVSPYERLVQSMRRCDRKVLPFLDRWVTVDVVLTNCEIVYFDAADSKKLLENNTDAVRRMKEVHQTLVSTQGGLGLRLCDVAFGRRIIGREELAKIEEIHVSRDMSHPGIPWENEVSGMPSTSEYWEDPVNTSNNEGDSYIMEEFKHMKGSQVKEDQLILKTAHGKLCLRFLGDFGNFEMNRDSILKESKAGEPIVMNHALQWCHTIVHLIGAEHLKQDLPHFGHSTSDEIRDYLTVKGAHHNMFEGQWHWLKNVVSSNRRLHSDDHSKDVSHIKPGVFS